MGHIGGTVRRINYINYIIINSTAKITYTNNKCYKNQILKHLQNVDCRPRTINSEKTLIIPLPVTPWNLHTKMLKSRRQKF